MNIKDFLLGYEAGAAQGGGSSADVRYVTFMSHDGTVELGKKAVAVGDDCADPIARGIFDTPTKESTAQYNYSFVGWATTPDGAWDETALDAVSEDRTVYAAYAAALRYYTITYYDADGTTVLKTENLAYGSTPSYTPEKEGYGFESWTPPLTTVTGAASYTAVWAEKLTFANASWAQIDEISQKGEAEQYFAIGDTKSITFMGYTGTARIVGFNHDDLATGGKAGISIILDCLTPNGKIWQLGNDELYNKFYTNSISGLETYFAADLRSVMKVVTKQYETTKNSGTSPSMGTVNGKLWIPSVTELDIDLSILTSASNPSNYIAAVGTAYEWFKNNPYKVSYIHNSTSYPEYWLRTLYRVGTLKAIYCNNTVNSSKNSLNASSTGTATDRPLRLGFCI